MAGFRQPRWKRRITIPPSTPKDRDGFLTLYRKHVARRFARSAKLKVVTFPFDLPSAPGLLRIIPMPAHPECEGHVASAECAGEWKKHWKRLRGRRPTVHVHECPFRKHCAVVPVVWRDRCLAVAKLVCPAEFPVADFDHHVEFLDTLTENFLTAVSRWLAKWITLEKPRRPASRRRARPKGPVPAGPNDAAYVARAVRFIRENFHDPELKVADIGPKLGFKLSDYLSRLFAKQMGRQMKDFLAECRLQRACWLLTNTRLGIKEVAFRSGFLYAHWFGLLFRDRFKVSPTGFRLAKSRAAEIPRQISEK